MQILHENYDKKKTESKKCEANNIVNCFRDTFIWIVLVPVLSRGNSFQMCIANNNNNEGRKILVPHVLKYDKA